MTIARDGRPVLIAALSGRALAAAAHRTREETIVLDRFADQDTVRLTTSCHAVPGGRHGFARRPFLAALEKLRGKVQGLVYGAGFERDPTLLADAAEIMPVLGNRPDVVAAIKDPFRFAALLARLDLPHPAIRSEAPAGPGWLRKAIGGSGGTHITPGARGRRSSGTYFQKAVAGRSVSATFVANGEAARVFGFTEQWVSASAAAPFRFGGCAGPVQLPTTLASTISAACGAIAGAAQLVGLNSLDMLVGGDRFYILEVNPRPGASLDVLDGPGDHSLWRYHREALDGHLPEPACRCGQVRAAQIMYASRRCVIPPAFAWPTWSADRGKPGTIIRGGEPICTVLATGATAALARRRAHDRGGQVLAQLAGRLSMTGVTHAKEAAPA